jgi:hypothetical protein
MYEGRRHPGRRVAVLSGIGGAGHVWLHSECWEPWREQRKAEAVSALATLGVHRPHSKSCLGDP